jgi:hypothetical protein
MRKFVSSLVLAVAVIGLPAVFTSMTGCSGGNEATQIEGVEDKAEEGHEEEFAKQQKEEDAAGGNEE